MPYFIELMPGHLHLDRGSNENVCDLSKAWTYVCVWVNSHFDQLVIVTTFSPITQSILHSICYVNISLSSLCQPICAAIISLFAISSDRFICKINLLNIVNISLLKGESENSDCFTPVNNTQDTVSSNVCKSYLAQIQTIILPTWWSLVKLDASQCGMWWYREIWCDCTVRPGKWLEFTQQVGTSWNFNANPGKYWNL